MKQSAVCLSLAILGSPWEAWPSEVPVPILQPHVYIAEPDGRSLFYLGAARTLLDLGQSETCSYIVRKDNTCGALGDARFISEAWFRPFHYQRIFPREFVEDELTVPWE